MGKDHYYDAFGDDDGGTIIPDEDLLAKTIDPHLVSKLLLGIFCSISVFAMIVHLLFQIELGKKITETTANVPDDMVLSVENPESNKGGTVAVIVNASVVQIPDPSDSGLTRTERKSPKASAMDSLETCKMVELVLTTVALVLIVLLLLVFLPSGNIIISVIGMTAVTGAFLKDQIKSEWRKERYDRILAIITLILFMASSLSLLTYAKMGIAEGSIYMGPARIVGQDDSQYTNVMDETITRIDLSVSWGGAWGCPRMDKTCYDKVEGALCEEKDDRAVRQLQQNNNRVVLEKTNNINMRRLETEEDDEVTYYDDGGKGVHAHIEEDDDSVAFDEEIDSFEEANGATEEFVDIEEANKDGSDEEVDEQVYYSADGDLVALVVEEYEDNADGTADAVIEDLEYEKVDGVNELVDEEVVEKNTDGSYEDENIEIQYESTPEGVKEVGEEVIDEKEDEDGNESVKETDYENVDGVLEEVSEDDFSEEIAEGADDMVDDNIGAEGENDDVEVLKEELKEANEENKELKDEIGEEEEEVEEEEDVEDEEEEEIDELEDEVEELYYENTYSFEDDIYEDDYWSGNDWDEQWGDYQCGQLFDTDLKQLPAFDSNTPPGDDQWPFVNIYGKCNTCDAYLIDYFSSEHFNNIKAYEVQGLYYGLVGLCGVIITSALMYWQKKQPGKERMLGLIPNENSNIV